MDVCCTLITSILFFLYSLIVFVPNVRFKPNKTIVTDAYKYSLPLLPHSVSSWFMSMMDRVLINNFLGSAKTGLYSVGYQFGSVVGITQAVLTKLFLPGSWNECKEIGKIYQIYMYLQSVPLPDIVF